jgi:sortase (surface protein transpeptidase)
MTTFSDRYRTTEFQQLLAGSLFVYAIMLQRVSAILPGFRKVVSRGFTALLLMAFVAGLYQLSSVASTEFRKPSQVVNAASAAAPVKPPIPVHPAGLPKSAPTRLEIPSINVDASFMAVGQTAEGALDVPPHDAVGWYTGAPTPGEIGPAIVVGHVDSSIYGPAVFFHLKELKPDDDVKITREDGSVVTFKVDKLESYDQKAFPSEAVYGNINYPGLRLITCDGDFNYSTRHYSNNLVVYAKKAP